MRGARGTWSGLIILAALLSAGCAPGGDPSAERDPNGIRELSAASQQSAPQPFGFGIPASAARIAMWDIDVKPDGEGLPPGSGDVAQGEAVYQLQCVACHGATGVEGPNDRLVSTAPWTDWPNQRAVGNYWPYATTLFDYISKAMPQLTPGTLSADETYAVIAYILNLNEIVGDDAVMNAEALPAVIMPARDRFVPDNRRGGAEVR